MVSLNFNLFSCIFVWSSRDTETDETNREIFTVHYDFTFNNIRFLISSSSFFNWEDQTTIFCSSITPKKTKTDWKRLKTGMTQTATDLMVNGGMVHLEWQSQFNYLETIPDKLACTPDMLVYIVICNSKYRYKNSSNVEYSDFSSF